MAWWVEVFRSCTGKSALVALFVFCAFPTGLMMSLITPPGQSPDEPTHLARAEGLLRGVILGVRKADIDPVTGLKEWHTGVKVDNGILHAGFGHVTWIGPNPVVTGPDFLADRAVKTDHSTHYINLPNTATYFPAAYVPAAIGLALGLAAHAPPYACFLLARLFMLVAYVAIGAAAIWIAAFGEGALMGVLLLPMTLFLGSTINEDGILAALSCLACAALTRGTPGYRVLGLAAFVLVLGAKPPYALMLGVFLLPLFKPGFWRRAREVMIALVPVVLWVVLITLFVVVPYGKQPYHPGPLFTGDRSMTLDHADAAANLHILLAQPSRFITLPAHTLYLWGLVIIWTAVGVLGVLQIVLPNGYCHAWEIACALALFLSFFSRRETSTPALTALVNFATVLGLLAVSYWLIMIMFYLDWTNVGEDYVDGLQGRYSLVLLPFLLFAIPGVRWRFRLPPLVPALPVVALGLYDMGYLPMKLVWNFYLH
jgi:uncharacterized membrane protein